MAAPPDPQDELLPLASPGSQGLGDRAEEGDEAVTPKGDKRAPQAGESGRGLGAGAGEVLARELGSGPARPPPVAMETASTGKAGGSPANGVGARGPSGSPIPPVAPARPSRSLLEHQPHPAPPLPTGQ